MTDNKKTDDTNVYEMTISFIQPTRAIVRIAATSEEMARVGLREMTDGLVRDLEIESIETVAADAPPPEGFEEDTPQLADDEDQKVIPLKKTVH